MKLRINRNSIRLRLNKTEVEKFANNERITDKLFFGIAPAEILSFTLEQNSVENIQGTFHDGEITVLVPTKIAEKWVTTDEVGFETEQVLNNGAILRILVEKDFVCLKPRENEDESDNYLHPAQGEIC